MEIGVMIRNMAAVDFNKIVDDSFTELMPEIIEINKDQLLGGKTRMGVNITPSYYDDPYFKSAGQAKGYAIWKKKLESSGVIPASKKYTKSFTTPNLYIQGTFHNNILGKVVDDYLLIGTQGFGSDFDKKYKDIYGLTPENMDVIIPKLFLKVITKYKRAIGIN